MGPEGLLIYMQGIKLEVFRSEKDKLMGAFHSGKLYILNEFVEQGYTESIKQQIEEPIQKTVICNTNKEIEDKLGDLYEGTRG